MTAATPAASPALDVTDHVSVPEDRPEAHCARVRTRIGELLVVQTDRGVLRISFGPRLSEAERAAITARIGSPVVASERELDTTCATLAAYLEGDSDRLDLAVDWRLVAGPFQRGVLEALHRGVPRGEVVTYGQLAALAGRPRAARAAGTACARNPVPLIVPCHRVVPSGGGVGFYGGGSEYKRTLLALEGVIAAS